MQDFCPLCLKNGIKKEIKLLQINLQEAVWICEEEKCIWPFGYEDFAYSQRVVGKIWSCYWNDCKPTASRSKDASAKHSSIKHELISNSNARCSKNAPDTESKIDSISACDNGNATRISNEERKCEESILNKEVSPGVCLDKAENEHGKEKDCVHTQNVKNGNNVRGIPKITSIEKTNIDISNVKIENQISVYQDPDKKSSAKAKSEIERLPTVGSVRNNEATPKSSLNVTMMEIDGLPPIKLSFEIPVCELNAETVVSDTQIDNKASNVKKNSPEAKGTFPRRSISSGKQYEKFSFSAIKRKVESCNSNENVEKVSNLNNCTSNHLDDSTTNSSSQDDPLSDSSTVNTSVNIDTVLEDFLTNDYNASEDINDDWINSLLS